MRWIVASDIDGTLTGDDAALQSLREQIGLKRRGGDLFFIVSTGRRYPHVRSGLASEGLPEPDAIVCQVGTEIYEAPFTEDATPLASWHDHQRRQYSADEALAFFDGIPGLRVQPALYNTDLKMSAYLDDCPDPDAAAAEVQRRALAKGDRYQVVYSSGRDLDVLPAAAGKGNAIRFLAEHKGFDPDKVIVAGDTGNDIGMFERFERGIVVANAQPELIDYARSRTDSSFFIATRPFAAGVAEGLSHYGVID